MSSMIHVDITRLMMVLALAVGDPWLNRPTWFETRALSNCEG